VRTRLLVACVLWPTLSIGAAPVLRGQAHAAEAPASGSTLSPALRVAVDRLADSARAVGVPVEPLYLKAAEGVLKGADDDRVVVVVGRLLGELREARRGLGGDATSAELIAGASVVHAGLDAGTLRRVRAARSDAHAQNALVMPLVVLADLVARRVTPAIATASVIALTERGAPDAEFASLRSVVESEIRRGQPPDAAARARVTAILRAMPGNQPAAPRGTPLDPTARP
jgi:hypothetical protein